VSGSRRPWWQKLLAVPPVLLLVALLPGQVLLRCQMDGHLRPSCCCPTSDDAPPAGPAFIERCCDRESAPEPVVRVASTWPPAVDLVPPIRAESALAAPAPTPRAPVRTAQESHAARGGPSLPIAKQALLI
jgi:hypothetical protein